MKRADNTDWIDPDISRRTGVLTAGWCRAHRHGPKLSRLPLVCASGCYGRWHKADGTKVRYGFYNEAMTDRCVKCGRLATSWGGHVHMTRPEWRRFEKSAGGPLNGNPGAA